MNAHPDIVVISASSGGLEALQGLLAALCDDRPVFDKYQSRDCWV
jgi:chemotaxis response regulator CheB